MNITRRPSIVATIALTSLAAFVLFGHAPLVHATAGMTALNAYIKYDNVLPSNTDGHPADVNGIQPDCPDTGDAPGIGCTNRWPDDLAINEDHYLYVPTSTPESATSGKLLLYLCGGIGNAAFCENVFPVAAEQGYHVIGLTYPSGPINQCATDHDLDPDQQLQCFEDFITENITGKCPSLDTDAGCVKSTISDHPQDAVVNRLISVLRWARQYNADNFSEDHGWDRYLTFTDGEYGINWAEVHFAGFSNGSSHASLMGTLYQDVGRVALFAGPNDGIGNSSGAWRPASFVRKIEGVTDTHYFGLVHRLNNAESPSDDVLYEVTKNWRAFGMEGPVNPHRYEYDPLHDTPPADFGGAHMLVATNDNIQYWYAHPSIPKNQRCAAHHTESDGKIKCDVYDGDLGYEPAWRCILGTGNKFASRQPFAVAGPDQTVECQANGGAQIDLDGSGSNDLDCDVLSYLWSGPFGQSSVRKPTVFLPLGTHTAELVVNDEWRASIPDTTSISVVDTIPPSLQVTLTPTSIWPPNHRLVRIDAVVRVADSCTPPQVVLTSITSDQPDDGTGDGDTAGDIEDAQVDTFDRSFLVRAERSGGDKNGRTYMVTYTATDASGNKTHASATVHVPH